MSNNTIPLFNDNNDNNSNTNTNSTTAQPPSPTYALGPVSTQPQESIYNDFTALRSSENSSAYGDSGDTTKNLYNSFSDSLPNDTPSEGLTINTVKDILDINLKDYEDRARIPVKEIFDNKPINKALRQGTLNKTYNFYNDIINNEKHLEYAHHTDGNKYYIAIPYIINSDNVLIMPQYTTDDGKEYNFYQCWVQGGSNNFDTDEVKKILENLSNKQPMGDNYMTHNKLSDSATSQSDGNYVLFYVKNGNFLRIDNVLSNGEIKESEQGDIVKMMT